MDVNSCALGQGLVYEDMLPLRWRNLEQRHTTLELARLQDNNEEVLRVIGVLDEYLSETGEEHAPLSQEMLRIETKLNVLLALLSQLVTLHYPQPPVKPVKLSAADIEWVSDEGARIGDYGVVEIYLSSRCQRPLVFPGTIFKVETMAGGYSIGMNFGELGDLIKERLEKIIFRHHRRGIALARRRASSDPGS